MTEGGARELATRTARFRLARATRLKWTKDQRGPGSQQKTIASGRPVTTSIVLTECWAWMAAYPPTGVVMMDAQVARRNPQVFDRLFALIDHSRSELPAKSDTWSIGVSFRSNCRVGSLRRGTQSARGLDSSEANLIQGGCST